MFSWHSVSSETRYDQTPFNFLLPCIRCDDFEVERCGCSLNVVKLILKHKYTNGSRNKNMLRKGIFLCAILQDCYKLCCRLWCAFAAWCDLILRSHCEQFALVVQKFAAATTHVFQNVGQCACHTQIKYGALYLTHVHPVIIKLTRQGIDLYVPCTKSCSVHKTHVLYVFVHKTWVPHTIEHALCAQNKSSSYTEHVFWYAQYLPLRHVLITCTSCTCGNNQT